LLEVGLVAKSPAGLISALFLEDFSSVGFDISPNSLLRKGLKQISCVEISSDLWIASQPVQKLNLQSPDRRFLAPCCLLERASRSARADAAVFHAIDMNIKHETFKCAIDGTPRRILSFYPF
jgi:hypothetical protein